MYVKLFDSILKSSIWDTPSDARITWITCLILCDQNGNFTATRSYLAREANLPLDVVNASLDMLLEPDTESTTAGDDGRRMEYCGNNTWHVINYAKYNEIAKAETVREQTRIRVAAHKERKRGESVTVTQGNAEVTQGNEKVTPLTIALPVPVTTPETTEAKNTPKPPKPGADDLFKFWTEVMSKPGAKLSPKRKKRIEWAISEYGDERARKAIIGCASSAFHMGENEQGKRFDDLELIFRNSEKFESFEALAEKAQTCIDATTGHMVVIVTPLDDKARPSNWRDRANTPGYDKNGVKWGVTALLERMTEEELNQEVVFNNGN